MAKTDAREAARRLIVLLRSEFSRVENDMGCFVVSFSGGLDSTLIARLAMDRVPVSGVVVGTDGSIDIRNARRSAESMGMDIQELKIDERLVVEGAKKIINATGSTDPLTIGFELPVLFALQSTKEKSVVTGQGADELFGGYAKYEGLPEKDFIRMRTEDVDRVLGPTSRIEEAMAGSLGKTVLRPFLSNEVVSFAMHLPASVVRPAFERKAVIREALRELGMDDIASIDKKAAQYGSGTSALLKKAAKRHDMSVGEFMIHLREEA
jgi:asparagine synthase (glutamine-hydrolysing)